MRWQRHFIWCPDDLIKRLRELCTPTNKFVFKPTRPYGRKAHLEHHHYSVRSNETQWRTRADLQARINEQQSIFAIGMWFWLSFALGFHRMLRAAQTVTSELTLRGRSMTFGLSWAYTSARRADGVSKLVYPLLASWLFRVPLARHHRYCRSYYLHANKQCPHTTYCQWT